MRGEHADGEFLIPPAVSEGTLVACYNRGMKVLMNMCGGAQVAAVAGAMQCAPVFVFRNARAGRNCVGWVAAQDWRLRANAWNSCAVMEGEGQSSGRDARQRLVGGEIT